MSGESGSRPSLRAVTYLAPGIPREFFDFVVDHLARTLDLDVSLSIESRSSGPMHGDVDPFASGEVDLGFVCSPSYFYLRSQPNPSVVLVPAGFVFEDPRNQGRPVYFSEVVVRRDHSASSFEELAGARWGYNDECSLSGYFSTLQELEQRGLDRSFFRDWARTGSHCSSIDAVLAGKIDGAAIDSIALDAMRRQRPELLDTLRVVASFGPYPIQPVVLRAGLQAELLAPLTEALLQLSMTTSAARERVSFNCCVPIHEAFFEEERLALSRVLDTPF